MWQTSTFDKRSAFELAMRLKLADTIGVQNDRPPYYLVHFPSTISQGSKKKSNKFHNYSFWCKRLLAVPLFLRAILLVSLSIKTRYYGIRDPIVADSV